MLLSRNEDLMDAWANPHVAEIHRGAVLDLFPADSLTRIEKKLGLANPAHEFREALAAVVWKYLRNVASEKVDRSKVKRRYDHRVAELSSIVAADSDEDAEVRYLMEASGVVAAVKRFSEIKVTNTGRPTDLDHYALIAALIALYESATGRTVSYTSDHHDSEGKKFKGPAYEFNELVDHTIAKSLGEPPRGNARIGGLLKAFVRARNERASSLATSP
jgi:hypothetical protein